MSSGTCRALTWPKAQTELTQLLFGEPSPNLPRRTNQFLLVSQTPNNQIHMDNMCLTGKRWCGYFPVPRGTRSFWVVSLPEFMTFVTFRVWTSLVVNIKLG